MQQGYYIMHGRKCPTRILFARMQVELMCDPTYIGAFVRLGGMNHS